MTGYEKSPDYGGPGKINWRTVAVLVVVVCVLVGAAVAGYLRQ